jgi:uncharacterized protein YndB with AHSA1/START domain
MLKKIAIAVLLVVVVFIAVVASRPSQFHVERSARVAAPPEAVFPLINDFHRWPSWSPWEKLDPGMQREYSGEPQGKGAAYAWTGNDDVGKGSMRIIESQPPSTVAIALEFKEPWQATNATLFSVNPDGDGSRVTWGMDGESNFMFKAVGLFMNMDEMVGKDFEAGLDNLARVAEVEAKTGAAAAPSP